ncbi:MAG: hypothetical protein E7180_01310 [Erysipelotrichaceae bacterium]|nr:hypothetical protein [Erysipelotrichaceae bacterium]
MKKIQRLQFILSPVLIAILSVLLVVVSFSWYQAAAGEIEFTEATTNVTVKAPEGTNVELIPVGDTYTYDSANGKYTLTSPETITGYFGQTGLGDINTNNNDKPYIIFYKAIIESDEPEGITINDCFVKGVVITKNEEEMENEEYLDEASSEFSAYFYTKDSNSYIFSNPQSTFTLDPGTSETEVYVGIVFFKEGSQEDFKFSNIKYYQSIYSLQISFYVNE